MQFDDVNVVLTNPRTLLCGKTDFFQWRSLTVVSTSCHSSWKIGAIVLFRTIISRGDNQSSLPCQSSHRGKFPAQWNLPMHVF